MNLEKLLLFYIPLGLALSLMVVVAAWTLNDLLPSADVEAAAPAAQIVTETAPLPTQPVTNVQENIPDPVEETAPQLLPRYEGITLSGDDVDLLAKVVQLEAGGESFQGQQAVAEVILNRMVTDGFPDTLYDVVWEKDQFSVMPYIDQAEPTETQYEAINAALYGPSVLPLGVVFFSRGAENRMVWGTIGGHVFCYRYYLQ